MMAAASRAASSALSSRTDRATFALRRVGGRGILAARKAYTGCRVERVIARAHDPLSLGRGPRRERIAMRLKGYRQSSNVEDRRGMSVGRGGAAIGGGGIVLLLVFALVTGQDPMQLLDQVAGTQSQVGSGGETGTMGAPSDEMGQFASTVLASTEDVWGQLMSGSAGGYAAPT